MADNQFEAKLEEVILKEISKLDKMDTNEKEKAVENIRKLSVIKLEQQKADIEYDKIVSSIEIAQNEDVRAQARYEYELEERRKAEIRAQAEFEYALEEKKIAIKNEKKSGGIFKVFEYIGKGASIAIPAALGVANLVAYKETRNMYMMAEYGEDPYGAMTSNGGRRTLEKGMSDLVKLK